MKSKEYLKLLEKNQAIIQESQTVCVREINKETKAISEELEIEDRLETIAELEPFITLNDHKPNFANTRTCHLINPTNQKCAGSVNTILEKKIVRETVLSIKVNLWRNTQSVISWFKDPGTYLLEPVAKENCENSKLAHGSSNKLNAEMLSEKVGDHAFKATAPIR